MANGKNGKTSWMSVTAVVVPLLCGGGGVWGVMQYMVERPLRERADSLSAQVQRQEAELKKAQTRNEQLEGQIKQAQLDIQDHELTVKNFKERQEVLTASIKLAKAAGEKEAAQALLHRLQDTMNEMDSRLNQLENNLQAKRVAGQGWFQGPLGGGPCKCDAPDLQNPIDDVRQLRTRVVTVKASLATPRGRS
jgi:septal ring factor EnvC (AmiA/AmiB activator)